MHAPPRTRTRPRWVTQPAVPAGCVTLPSGARSKTATPLGNRLPATYTWVPSGLTATLVGSFSARPTTQPPPGRWLTQPLPPGSWVSTPVRWFRAKMLSASLAAETR